MARLAVFVVILAAITISMAQRPFYAGVRPIGYPVMATDTYSQLSNRFGEDAPVPIETKGNVNLINRIDSLPIDNRPFWYTNWQYYDALRRRPQTWPIRPNNFIN
ncbi:unnamed protein product [Diatraea saccharalis]|uniref:Seminal fluid protein HACP044 n=1 Tax=Diatraea saccharalis TaxID=40085 RepID=A0A9N9R346_9NEOP|nr:unnamed protein product [Diatraea saccharalis]